MCRWVGKNHKTHADAQSGKEEPSAPWSQPRASVLTHLPGEEGSKIWGPYHRGVPPEGVGLCTWGNCCGLPRNAPGGVRTCVWSPRPAASGPLTPKVSPQPWVWRSSGTVPSGEKVTVFSQQTEVFEICRNICSLGLANLHSQSASSHPPGPEPGRAGAASGALGARTKPANTEPAEGCGLSFLWTSSQSPVSHKLSLLIYSLTFSHS